MNKNSEMTVLTEPEKNKKQNSDGSSYLTQP